MPDPHPTEPTVLFFLSFLNFLSLKTNSKRDEMVTPMTWRGVGRESWGKGQGREGGQ